MSDIYLGYILNHCGMKRDLQGQNHSTVTQIGELKHAQDLESQTMGVEGDERDIWELLIRGQLLTQYCFKHLQTEKTMANCIQNQQT